MREDDDRITDHMIRWRPDASAGTGRRVHITPQAYAVLRRYAHTHQHTWRDGQVPADAVSDVRLLLALRDDADDE